ncbi:MAG: antibiotic biosynthesis monooxygenase [Desulfatitalea sp.]|nr:antibiotic biosynthesis monooxygenase [Desulfatitalea sp.]NNK00348.1 antibiotic biosynthesis monooxygenase [Desulfatitalea sp.]
MAIKVFIRRRFPKEQEKALVKCIRQIREVVPSQPGYISGEYLKAINIIDEITTISSWFSLEDWQNWYDSDVRRSIQARIDSLAGVSSEYTIYRVIKTR